MQGARGSRAQDRQELDNVTAVLARYLDPQVPTLPAVPGLVGRSDEVLDEQDFVASLVVDEFVGDLACD